MTSRARPIWPGALGGMVSSLCVMALNTLGSWAYGFAFLPYLYFDWLVRVLPGWIVVPSIERMVQWVTRLAQGPVDAVAKTIENGLAMSFFVLAGSLVGAVILLLAQSTRSRIPIVAWITGALLFIATLLIESSSQFGHHPALAEIVGQAFLFFGWGSIFGIWVFSVLKCSEPDRAGVDLTRRRLLVTLGAGALLPFMAYLASGWVSRWAAAPVLSSKPAPSETPTVGIRATVPQRTVINSTLPVDQTATPVVTAVVTAVTTGVSPTPVPSDSEVDSSAARAPDRVAADGRLFPAPGTRVELTDNNHFYRVDINSDAPKVDTASWRLRLEGLVDRPAIFSLEELRQRPAVDQNATLSCISNTLGGKLISNTRWTGIRLKDLLIEAGLKPHSVSVQIDAQDGFYENTPLVEAIDDRALLVYAMNGEPLSPEHGFPLRIFIPGHYGMKQPKWITRLTVIDRLGTGFWSDRGWSKEARVNTMSSIDTAAASQLDPGSQTVPLGGIAFAGERGISRVEIQMDNGPWIAARLRTPPLSALSWVQWRANVPYKAGDHTFRVRATDGRGSLQPGVIGDIYPNGATGLTWVDVTF